MRAVAAGRNLKIEVWFVCKNFLSKAYQIQVIIMMGLALLQQLFCQ